MRALLSHQAGGPEGLVFGEVTDPVAEAGTVVVAVHACGLNFPDLLIIADKYQLKPARPFAPGGEVAGTVESVGPGVPHWQRGDWVIGFTAYGGLAERVAVKAAQLYRLPDERSFVEGASLLFTHATALHGLRDRGRLQAGDHLLVLGAAGGIGLAAVEIGKVLGARVTAAVSTTEKARAALGAGADAVVVYGPAPFEQPRALAEKFKQAGGSQGFDAVFDPVGGDYAEAALRAVSWGGRYLVVGFPAGIPRLPMNLPLLKGCDICGVFWGSFAERDPQACARGVELLFDWWREGRIAPRIAETYAFGEGGKALARVAERGIIGKIVVAMATGC